MLVREMVDAIERLIQLHQGGIKSLTKFKNRLIRDAQEKARQEALERKSRNARRPEKRGSPAD